MSNKPPLNRDVAGDYYAGDQVGANVGGHGNTNHVFNGGEEDFKTQLTKIKAIYGAQKQSMQRGDYYATLGQVHTMKDSLDKLLAEVNAFNDKVQADFDNKFPRNVVSNMVERSADQGWKTVGKHGKQG